MSKNLTQSLAWGGGIVALALACTVARSLGYIDQETSLRIVLGATGLMIASFGNRIPKQFVSGAGARKAQRVTAWAMVLSGMIYAGAFMLAPLSAAMVIGCGAVILGLAVSFGYCLSLRRGTAAA